MPGGAEILVKNLSIELSRQLEIEIWSLISNEDIAFENDVRQQLESHNIKTLIIGKRFRKDRIKTIYNIRRLIINRQPNIIHSHLEHVTFYVIMSSLGLGVLV